MSPLTLLSCVSRLGASRFTTPREIVRDLVSVLNLIQQNPDLEFNALIHSDEFKPMVAAETTEDSIATNDDSQGVPATAEPQADTNVGAKFKSFTL